MKIRKYLLFTVPLVIVLLIALIIQYQFKQNQIQLSDIGADTMIKSVIQTKPILQYRPFEMSYLELIGREKLHNMNVLSLAEIQTYQIEAIDAFYDTLYKYHFVDSVCTNSNGTLLLIAREYVNENIIWLCTFHSNNRLLNTKQVFYDNAEGNFLIESKLVDNVLTLNTDDVNDGKDKEEYHISSNLELIKTK